MSKISSRLIEESTNFNEIEEKIKSRPSNQPLDMRLKEVLGFY